MRVDIAAILEMINNENVKVVWITSSKQTANSHTKQKWLTSWIDLLWQSHLKLPLYVWYW